MRIGRVIRRAMQPRPPKPLANIESEIPTGPRLSLALRARRGLMVLGAALGLAACADITGRQYGPYVFVEHAVTGILPPTPRRDP